MKRAFSIILSMAILVLCFSAFSFTVSAELQMEGNYYIINSEEEFMSITDVTAKYLIRNNLDLSSYSYTPIGTENAPFSGELIGNLNGVSGAKVAIRLNLNTTGDNQGLIGYLSGGLAKVENIVVKGSITANSAVGGIVGNFVSGTINNCDNYAKITSTIASGYAMIGGIAGYASSKTANITNCSNYGGIVHAGTGTYIGGIIGRTNGPVSITNCFNKSNISTSGSYVGGIVGGMTKATTVKNCSNLGTIDSTGATGYVGGIVGNLNGKITQSFNTGNIKGAANVGGIAGYANSTGDQEISHCYNNGNVAVSVSTKSVAGICHYLGKTDATSAMIYSNYNIGTVSGTTVKNYAIFYNSAIASGGTQKISSNFVLSGLTNPAVATGLAQPAALTSVQMQTLSNFQSTTDADAFSSSIWKINVDDPYGYKYPQLVENPHKEFTLPSTVEYNSNDSYTLSWESDDYASGYIAEVILDSSTLLTQNVSTNSLTLSVNELLDGKQVYTVKVTAVKDSGNVVVDNISLDMRYAGGKGVVGDEYKIATLRQLKNISLQSSAAFTQIAEFEEALTEPIASFAGKYNGNGYSIALQINKENDNNIALFATTSSATIEGVVTIGSVKGYKYVAALIGQGSATISNCENKATITALNDGVGGLVGYATTGSSLTNCANINNVSGNAAVGGIVGFSYGTISNSYNLGNITAISATGSSGGIAGSVRFNDHRGLIENCYNTGVIKGIYSTGIAFCGFDTGLNLLNCYSIGEANYPIGFNSNKDAAYSFENCYYLLNGSQDPNAIEKTISTLSTMVLGEKFKTISSSDIYIYPQIIGNLQKDPFQLETVTITLLNEGGNADKIGTRYVKKNAAYELVITADYDYVIDDIKLNGSSIGGNIIGEYSISPVINNASTIDISFKDRPLDILPGSIAPDTEAAKQMVPENYNEPLVFNETLTITTPYGVAFAKIVDYYGFTLKEYGMIFSKTDEELNINSSRAHRAQGTIERNSLGQFGVLFYGKGIEEGTTYYIRAYAIYNDGANDIVLYGDKILLTTAN